jgi:hypothetical protein
MRIGPIVAKIRSDGMTQQSVTNGEANGSAGRPLKGRKKEELQMSRLHAVDPSVVTEKVKILLDSLKAKLDLVSNTRAMANPPSALEAHLGFSGALAGGQLDPKLQEKLALLTTPHDHCDTCLSPQSAIGKIFLCPSKGDSTSLSLLKASWMLSIAIATIVISVVCSSAQASDSKQSPKMPQLSDPSLYELFSGPVRQKNLDSLHDPSLPGAMQAFYSPGFRVRAEFLQNLLTGEFDYYSKKFGTEFAPVTLAVLTPEQWTKVVPFPYALPSMTMTRPYIFTMPSDWSKSTTFPFPQKKDVDLATLNRARSEGHTWETLRWEGGDGIGTHEIGHSISWQLGIDPHVHWFAEFLASYIGYAYLKAEHPEEVLGNELFWKAGFLNTPHPHTSIEYLETHYKEIPIQDPANYAWYEFALDQRLLEVYQQQGFDFLVKVRNSFPVDASKLNTAEVLDRLEAMQPGWKAWAQRMESIHGTASAAQAQ